MVLTQEVLCVLIDTSPLLPLTIVVAKVGEMALQVQFSGYNKQFQYQVADSAIET